jgi:mono/diheme cytochrome c family protein
MRIHIPDPRSQASGKRGVVRGAACGALLALLAGCATRDPLAGYEELTPATVMEAPPPASDQRARDPEQVAHGRYLVELLGCGTCHTDGALIGEPRSDRRLAGSSVGIAYSDPVHEPRPGVVYPRNLTPDPATGLGRWSDEQMIRAIRGGVNKHGTASLLVMPWGAFSKMSDGDVRAIVAYLRSLPPVQHQVPQNAPPGTEAPAPFVHFGVYRSTGMP